MRNPLSHRPIIAFLALLVGACALSSAKIALAQDFDAPDLVERVKPAVVLIVTETTRKNEFAQASGFFIRPDQIISNWHVVKDAKTIFVKTAQGEVLKVKSVIATDRERDLALLQLESPVDGIRPLEIATAVPREGEFVMVVGNPKGLQGSNSPGSVSAVRGSPDKVRTLQITAPISPGSSGSPVVNKRAQVVGVISFIFGAREGGQNLNFAISSEHIAKLYSDSSDTAQLLPNRRLPNQSTTATGLDNADTDISPAAAKMSRDFYYQGAALLSNKDCNAALPSFEKAVVVNPRFADAWFSLAFCKSELGRVNAAIDDYRRVLQLKPDMYDAHWNIASLYFGNKRYHEAAASYKKVVALKPDSAEGYFNLGLSSVYGSESGEAIAAFKEVIRLKPDSAPAYYMLGRTFLYSGNYSDAVESFRRADLFRPNHPWTIYSWGIALIEQKNYDAAVDKLKEAINLKSDFSEVYSGLGLAYYRSRQYELAITQYKKAIELKADNIEPYQGLSNIYIRLGKKDESVALFRDLVAKKPADAEALVMLGAALIQTGNDAEAQQYIQQAYRLNPNDADARNIIGYNYTLMGAYDKATVQYNEAVRLAPGESFTYSGRAWNYLYARNGNGAASDALKFLSLEGWRAEHSPYMVLVAQFGYRLDHRDQDARKVLLDCASKCITAIWPFPIVRYLKGEIPATTLMNSATDNDKMTEARAYIGMNLSLLGQAQEALKHFEWVKENGNKDFTEYPLAVSQSKYIEALPKPSTSPSPVRRPLSGHKRRP